MPWTRVLIVLNIAALGNSTCRISSCFFDQKEIEAFAQVDALMIFARDDKSFVVLQDSVVRKSFSEESAFEWLEKIPRALDPEPWFRCLELDPLTALNGAFMFALVMLISTDTSISLSSSC